MKHESAYWGGQAAARLSPNLPVAPDTLRCAPRAVERKLLGHRPTTLRVRSK